jgi:hypothetical protein
VTVVNCCLFLCLLFCNVFYFQTSDGSECCWNDVAAAFMVRANALIPSEVDLFYFEVEVLDEGHDSVSVIVVNRGM